MECFDCLVREGVFVCEEFGFSIFVRGEEGVEWSGEDGSDEFFLLFILIRVFWNKMEFCYYCFENWLSIFVNSYMKFFVYWIKFFLFFLLFEIFIFLKE